VPIISWVAVTSQLQVAQAAFPSQLAGQTASSESKLLHLLFGPGRLAGQRAASQLQIFTNDPSHFQIGQRPASSQPASNSFQPVFSPHMVDNLYSLADVYDLCALRAPFAPCNHVRRNSFPSTMRRIRSMLTTS